MGAPRGHSFDTTPETETTSGDDRPHDLGGGEAGRVETPPIWPSQPLLGANGPGCCLFSLPPYGGNLMKPPFVSHHGCSGCLDRVSERWRCQALAGPLGSV